MGPAGSTGPRAEIATPPELAGSVRRLAHTVSDRASALGGRLDIDGPDALTWRRRHVVEPRRSAGGRTVLVPTADSWVALALPRPDDVASLPALLDVAPADLAGGTDVHDPLTAADIARLAAATCHRTSDDLVTTAAWLGMACAEVASVAPTATPTRVVNASAGSPRPSLAGAVVVNLASLWAGPLVAHLLGRAGADVVTVESATRPDAMRHGDPALYERLHEGHRDRAVDLTDPAGRAELAGLVANADIVIEGSRPRALRQLGIDADAVVNGWRRRRAGGLWISITGYGRDDPRQRIAFGDDAAVAGGLVAGPADDPGFVGDAIADPITGLTATAAALAAWSDGTTALLDVAMAAAAAATLRLVGSSW